MALFSIMKGMSFSSFPGFQKALFITMFFICTSSFDLYSKEIFLLAGSEEYNIDDISPGTPGKIGQPGSRSGAISWMENNRQWLFGGVLNNSKLQNDMWAYSERNWTVISAHTSTLYSGNYPSSGPGSFGYPAARWGAGYWIDSTKNLILFGGQGTLLVDGIFNGPSFFLNDFWRFNVRTNIWTWLGGDRPTEDTNRADTPAKRTQPVTWVHNDRYYLFGGLLADLSVANDLWVLNGTSRTWTLLSDNQPGVYNSAGGYPWPRYGATVSVDANNAWIFGGNSGNDNYLSDVWKYTPSTGRWEWAGGRGTPNDVGLYTAVGSPGHPPAREGACSWFDLDGYFWLYGGRSFDANGVHYYGDFWKADITVDTNFIWAGTSDTLVFPLFNRTGSPGPRAFAACFMDSIGDMFIFGGNTSIGYRNDLWVIDMNECETNNGGCWGNCTNVLAGAYKCAACPYGTKGDPKISCTDIDECSIEFRKCDPIVNCTNLEAADPICGPCPPGYSGTGYTKCYDTKICHLIGNCDPLVNCTPGENSTATCGPCPIGYTGTGNTSCIDIDECAVRNGGCDLKVNCTNLLGGLAPICGDCPNYYTGSGYSSCIDIDECVERGSYCDIRTTCKNNIGAPPTCGPCPSGFHGTGDTKCEDIDECAIDNGGCGKAVCTNIPGGKPTCGPCINGFIGNNWCSSGAGKGTSAGLIAGVTIGGFAVLLAVIGLIFHFTKDKVAKSPSTARLSTHSSPQTYELTALSRA